MIVFYNKITGAIVGTVDGRVHPKEHLNMWVGDKAETDRIIVNWKAVKYFNRKGEEIDPVKNKKELWSADFKPIHKQVDLFIGLDKEPMSVYNYKVDIKTKNLIPLASK